MALTVAELATIGSSTIDHYLRNKPIDQIAIETSLLSILRKKQKTFPAGLNVVENIRTNHSSNFQWIKGSGAVTYNHRNTIRQAVYPWSGWHDGLSLSEDELKSNGIVITDDDNGGKKYNKSEVVRLVNLLVEQMETLFEGAKIEFARQLFLDGIGNVDAIPGIDHMIAINPLIGLVGGIDRATSTYWRNNTSAIAIPIAILLNVMEQHWRACTLNGGRPDILCAGGAFIDAYASATQTSNRIIVQSGSQPNLEGGYSELKFKGVPIVWDPVLDDLDISNPVTGLMPKWSNRCYMINSKHLRLRPMEGCDFIKRKPERVYNNYIQYWAITWTGALTMNRANAHSVLFV